ncbi:MAG: hypothetical protein MJ236_02530 [Clostridia bacterium]|nr:hypothetical protein [Clostridia bacterium]
MNTEIIHNYFKSLVDSFFKILPMRESDEGSLKMYIKSLQRELIGCKTFIVELQNDPLFLRLLSILQFFIDNPDEEIPVVKSEVFKAISICNKLKAAYDKEVTI